MKLVNAEQWGSVVRNLDGRLEAKRLFWTPKLKVDEFRFRNEPVGVAVVFSNGKIVRYA